MKIRVSYALLKSDCNYGNRRAEVEIEMEVTSERDLDQSFALAWKIARDEVKKQLETKENLLF